MALPPPLHMSACGWWVQTVKGHTVSSRIEILSHQQLLGPVFFLIVWVIIFFFGTQCTSRLNATGTKPSVRAHLLQAVRLQINLVWLCFHRSCNKIWLSIGAGKYSIFKRGIYSLALPWMRQQWPWDDCERKWTSDGGCSRDRITGRIRCLSKKVSLFLVLVCVFGRIAWNYPQHWQEPLSTVKRFST